MEQIRSITRSDELSELRTIFSQVVIFASINNILQINLILDANAILSDIRWLVCKAHQKDVRTGLIESIDAGTVIAFAPSYIEVEIQKNIPIIADEEGVDPQLFFDCWDSIKQKINFNDCGGPETGYKDPKDVPYLKLYKTTGYPVVTNDSHLSEMGAKTVKIQVTALAKSYSREAVIEYKIKMIGIGTVVLTNATIKAVVELIRSIVKGIHKIPVWALLIVLSGFIYMASNNSFRLYLKTIMETLPPITKECCEKLFSIVLELNTEHSSSKLKANEARKTLLNDIGVS